MEEKESTISGSPGNSDTDDSPPPVSSSVAVHPPPINMNVGGHENVNLSSVATLSGGGGSVDLFGKKKRGRPRKYDADGNLRVQPPPPFHTSPLGFSFSSPSSDHSSTGSSKRGRGRPPGSGNWQLLASLGELFANTAGGDFTPHVITVNTGEDVAGKVMSFSQKGPRGVCVLSANGAVSNVTIRQPGSSGGILTYEGRFEILSLTGSFTVTENGGARSRTGGLSVSLASPDGRVIGGGVAGMLLAASPIQIVIGSFMPNGYKVHKRKYQREHTTASPNPSSAPADIMTTSAKPMAQGKPEGETCLTPAFQLQQKPNHHEVATANMTNGNQTANTINFQGVCWNGTEPLSNRRPSPDINVSVPSEDEIKGVL